LGGAIVILGMIAVLGAAYLILGRLRITEGRSGQKIIRFKAFERFSHWAHRGVLCRSRPDRAQHYLRKILLLRSSARTPL